MNNYEQVTQEVRDAFQALCKGRVEAAVKAEREACAMRAWSSVLAMTDAETADRVLAAIRARSNT